jgi:hypothetical protein
MTILSMSLDEIAAFATMPHLAGMMASSDTGELIVRRWSAAWFMYVCAKKYNSLRDRRGQRLKEDVISPDQEILQRSENFLRLGQRNKG